MNIALQNTLYPNKAADISDHFVKVSQPVEEPQEDHPDEDDRHRGLFRFVSELRRRRVCRAATMYAVSLWLICQVLEIVAPEMGLPDWTLKVVIVFGLLGFPITLLLSWLLEITPNGLVIDDSEPTSSGAIANSGPRRPLDRMLDCTLVLAALIIAVQLGAGILSTETNVAESFAQRIAVVPFRVASGNDASALSEGLLIELQHELATQTTMTVIAPRDPYLTTDCLSLTGAVAIGQDYVRVTATIIDNTTHAVTWSQVFERPRTDTPMSSVQFARDIVAALPTTFVATRTLQADHAT